MPSQRPPVPGARGRGLKHNMASHHPSPVLVSPIKRRQRATAPGINKQSDLEVWELSDEDIIGEPLAFKIRKKL
jgi:hypothetical protein